MKKKNDIRARSMSARLRANPISLAMERDQIRGVLAEWALSRDTGRWKTLRSLYAPGAAMKTTWFDGSADEFVDRSAAGFGKTAKAQHLIGASVIDLRGTRAIAETRITLLLRTALGSVQVDITCIGRFVDFFVKQGSRWRIFKREPVYEKDRIDTVNPREQLDIDRQMLSRFGDGYRHTAYVQTLAGANVTKGLIEPGSIEEQHLYRECAEWLANKRSSA